MNETDATPHAAAAAALRPPDTVMRPARMGAFHQTRLSFMRALLRRLEAERWRFSRPLWRVDERGEGVALYRAERPGGEVYSLVAFAHDLPDELRSDRVIAERWDATFVLVDGEPDEADIERLSRNVPLQEAGRCSERELVLSRANRSVRLFEHVVASLAAGRQPDAAQIDQVGYLMRTTAVYGNGKFGIADRARIAGRPALAGPFRAEMLSVWLTRAFTVDIAEHLARVRSPATVVAMDRDLRRRLGVGNSTGLGMAPFLMNHPTLLHAWILARETALARVRALPRTTPEAWRTFTDLVGRARCQVAGWQTADRRQMQRITALGADLERLAARVATLSPESGQPWDALYRWAEATLAEAQEMLVALLIEPHGALVDDLADTMSVEDDGRVRIDGSLPVARLREWIEQDYGWALAIDFDGERRRRQARFWYVSVEKLEPRLGERFEEPGAELEQPYGAGRDIAALYRACAGRPGDEPIAELLVTDPVHRHAVRRVQTTRTRPYAEIRDNLLDADLVPVDLLRCKLSFFGATRFDPRSDRWVRITMYKDAPFPDEFDDLPADDWGIAAGGGGVMGPFSLNEVENQCRRAARGAGMSVGLAEEAGRAAAWLAAHRLPGAERLAAVLERNQALDYREVAPITTERPWRARGVGVLCPVCTGAAVSDRANLLLSASAIVEIGRCLQPLLLLPFAAQAAPAGGAIEVAWAGARVAVGTTTLALLVAEPGALLAVEAGSVTLQLARLPPAGDTGRDGPVEVEDAAWKSLSDFAHRTYVPASEASRTRGAGAAASDND